MFLFIRNTTGSFYFKVSKISINELSNLMNNKKIYYFFGKDIDYDKDLIGKNFVEREANRNYFSNFKIVRPHLIYF